MIGHPMLHIGGRVERADYSTPALSIACGMPHQNRPRAGKNKESGKMRETCKTMSAETPRACLADSTRLGACLDYI